MPIFDYECPECGTIFEKIAKVEETTFPCECGHMANRIISASGAYCSNEDAEWIRSVREVVDKEGGAHCQEFLKSPTRENYRRWMKREGIRPFEAGEKNRKPDQQVDEKRVAKLLRERNAIEIR